MFGIGISISTLRAEWVSEDTYGWMSRNGDVSACRQRRGSSFSLVKFSIRITSFSPSVFVGYHFNLDVYGCNMRFCDKF